MKPAKPDTDSLEHAVRAVQHEFDMAITFHELWKPAAYDKDLHSRMGKSYATNAFHVVRAALRREMLLALMRLWDTNRQSIRMEKHIGAMLRDEQVIKDLAAKRASNYGSLDVEEEMYVQLARLANEAVNLIDRYSKAGTEHAVLKKLRTLRHEYLAHHQLQPSSEKGPDATDAEIESFFQANLKLLHLLLRVVAGVHYDPEDSAKIHRRYATLFWAGVCGERTEGHPNYKKPPQVIALT